MSDETVPTIVVRLPTGSDVDVAEIARRVRQLVTEATGPVELYIEGWEPPEPESTPGAAVEETVSASEPEAVEEP